MADKKISELTPASEIKNGDNLELSQDTGSGLVSLKATILAIANKILKGINFTSDLQTTEKTVIGAINEVAQGGGGGSSTLGGLNDVDIDDTTLADGQALVYNGTEEKWVNGQGGGGTGGHTIINENGNSMTARAGLQFIGGANVSDDATNNKTIVDLASAGGIDGVFIDTDNVVFSETINDGSIAHSTYSYTATEDCMAVILANGNPSGNVTGMLNGVAEVFRIVSAGIFVKSLIPMKKGQTLSFTGLQAYAYFAVFGIQTGTTHSKFQPVIYSLEEREIGVWTDGKPLYQKSFSTGSITIPANGSQTIDITNIISNYEKIISIQGYNNTFNSVLPTVMVASALTPYQVGIATDLPNIVISRGSGGSITSEFIITLCYTKSTDTAGSGTWTPQGVPTHHYSTDEQVIGTYLGETLYEKTYVSNTEISISAGNQGNNVSSLIDNLSTMAQVVNCFATNEIANGCMPLVADNSANGFVVYTFIGNSFKKLTVQYTKTS